MSLLERWQGRRYRRRYGLRSRNGALDAARAAMRERPDVFDTPGGRAYVANLCKVTGCASDARATGDTDGPTQPSV